MDRWTKGVVIASTIVALAYETIYSRQDIPSLPFLALAAAALCFVAARARPEQTVGIVLACGYLVPIVFFLLHGHFRPWYLGVWKAALVGAAAPSMKPGWQYPKRFQFAFVSWALAVALTWPIVALREIDWNPFLLWWPPPTVSSAVHAVPETWWIAQMTQVHLLGLLSVDWVLGRFRGSDPRAFERRIVFPLLVLATVAAGLAVYQGFVSLQFMTIGEWSHYGRASGALADGNASGSLSALWVALPLALAVLARSWLASVALAGCSVLSFLAVWTTGSRTALLGAVVSLAMAPRVLLDRSTRWRSGALLFGWLAIIVLAGSLVLLPSRVGGPLARIRLLMPNLAPATILAAASELWTRNGYGSVAMAIIKDEPLAGVGIGTFHTVGVEYSRSVVGWVLPADNAQNWLRHQVAELGVLGSLGLVCWTLLAIPMLARPATVPELRLQTTAVKATILGFALASMLGMPGQNVIVALTFWTFVAWWMLCTLTSDAAIEARAERSRRWTSTSLATVTALAFVAFTWYAASGDLRPPFRAKRFGSEYRYGFHRPFEGADGEITTSARAVAVRHAPAHWLKISVWVEHPDADADPVPVELWFDGKRIARRPFPRNVPFTRWIPITAANGMFVLETRVGRTFVPDPKQPAEVGLRMKWSFSSVNADDSVSSGN